MSATSSQALYEGVHDPIYSVLNKQVAVSQDTLKKATRRIPASSNGSGSIAVPLNGLQTVFNFSNGTNYKMRWDTTRLNVGGVFTAMAAVTTAVACSPPWNLFGQLIDEIALNFNGHGTAIYTKTGANLYKACFTARLLRHYTMEQLEKMSDFLFTPIEGDKYYLRAHVNETEFANDGNVIKSDGAAYIQFANADGAAAIADPAAAFWSKDKSSLSGGAAERQRKYIGADSATRTQFLSIPFADLFPRFQGVPKNLRSVQIMIKWAPIANIHMEYANCANANAGGVIQPNTSTGTFRITSCDIVTDDYVMSAGQSMESVQEKLEAEPDNIAFMDTEVLLRDWTANDIILPSKKNLDSLMMIQFSDDVHNLAETNGQYNWRYQSSGQFLFFNGQAAANNVFRLSSDIITANTTVNPTMLQIEYGDVQYPNNPIQLLTGSATTHFKSDELYYEYIKAFGKVGDRVTGQPMSKDLFCSTMPFVFLKPYSNEAIKLSDTRDLVIKMTGASGNVSTAPGAARFSIILFSPKFWRIAVDGTLSTPSS